MNLNICAAISATILTLGLSAPSSAEVQLFLSDGTPKLSYDYSILHIAHQALSFPDGSTLAVGEYLGSGNMTAVYALNEKDAVRFAKKRLRNTEGDIYLQTLYHYLDGALALEESSIPRSQVQYSKSKLPYYIVVERVHEEFTGDAFIEFYSENPRRKTYNDFHVQQLIDGLIEFARSTWAYSSLGLDFSWRQLVWNGNEWVLVDYYLGVEKCHLDCQQTVFKDSLFDHKRLQNLKKLLVSSVIEKRNQMACMREVYRSAQ